MISLSNNTVRELLNELVFNLADKEALKRDYEKNLEVTNIRIKQIKETYNLLMEDLKNGSKEI